MKNQWKMGRPTNLLELDLKKFICKSKYHNNFTHFTHPSKTNSKWRVIPHFPQASWEQDLVTQHRASFCRHLKLAANCFFSHNGSSALWSSNSMNLRVWTTYFSLIWKAELFFQKSSNSLIGHYDFKGCQRSTKIGPMCTH